MKTKKKIVIKNSRFSFSPRNFFLYKCEICNYFYFYVFNLKIVAIKKLLNVI